MGDEDAPAAAVDEGDATADNDDCFWLPSESVQQNFGSQTPTENTTDPRDNHVGAKGREGEGEIETNQQTNNSNNNANNPTASSTGIEK